MRWRISVCSRERSVGLVSHVASKVVQSVKEQCFGGNWHAVVSSKTAARAGTGTVGSSLRCVARCSRAASKHARGSWAVLQASSRGMHVTLYMHSLEGWELGVSCSGRAYAGRSEGSVGVRDHGSGAGDWEAAADLRGGGRTGERREGVQ